MAIEHIREQSASQFAPQTNSTGKKSETKKAVDPGKAVSVQLVDRDIEAFDLFTEYNQDLSKAGIVKNQSSLEKKAKQEAETSLQEWLGEAKENGQDEVKLSTSVIAYKTDALKKQRQSDQIAQATIENVQQEAEEEIISPKTTATLSQVVGQLNQKEQKKRLELGANQQSLSEEVGETSVRETLTKYVSTFSESVIKKSPHSKQALATLRQQLQQQGCPTKRVLELETRVRSVMSQDLRKQIKKGFLDYALTYSPKNPTSDYLKKFQNLKTVMQMADLSAPLGVGTEDILKEERNLAKTELRSFITDEITQGLVERFSKGEKEEKILAFFNKFTDISRLCLFDENDFMRSWLKKMDHLGLNYFENTPKGVVDDDPEGDRGEKQQQADHDSDEQSSDLAEDQLRLLFMQKLLKTDIRSMIDTSFKIRRLKNGMKRLGIYREDLIKRLEAEGVGLARLKFLEMLKEGFEERATLAELKGPAYHLVENKLKAALTGLRKLHPPVPTREIEDIRTTVNKDVFSITKEEFLKLEVKIETDPENRFLIGQQKRILAILERLKTESPIIEEIRPQAFAATWRSKAKIIEAA